MILRLPLVLQMLPTLLTGHHTAAPAWKVAPQPAPHKPLHTHTGRPALQHIAVLNPVFFRDPQVKNLADLALPQLWHMSKLWLGFSPWSGKSHMLRVES